MNSRQDDTSPQDKGKARAARKPSKIRNRAEKDSSGVAAHQPGLVPGTSGRSKYPRSSNFFLQTNISSLTNPCSSYPGARVHRILPSRLERLFRRRADGRLGASWAQREPPSTPFYRFHKSHLKNEVNGTGWRFSWFSLQRTPTGETTVFISLSYIAEGEERHVTIDCVL